MYSTKCQNVSSLELCAQDICLLTENLSYVASFGDRWNAKPITAQKLTKYNMCEKMQKS